MRPPDNPALCHEALCFDEMRNSFYVFGGFRPFSTNFTLDSFPPSESIWKFELNGRGGGNWSELLGPVSSTPFPSNLHRIAGGLL